MFLVKIHGCFYHFIKDYRPEKFTEESSEPKEIYQDKQ
jgi:hypothetical protein